jgi:hypothetical protein
MDDQTLGGLPVSRPTSLHPFPYPNPTPGWRPSPSPRQPIRSLSRPTPLWLGRNREEKPSHLRVFSPRTPTRVPSRRDCHRCHPVRSLSVHRGGMERLVLVLIWLPLRIIPSPLVILSNYMWPCIIRRSSGGGRSFSESIRWFCVEGG